MPELDPATVTRRLEELGVLATACDACGGVDWRMAKLPSQVDDIEIRADEIELSVGDGSPGSDVVAVVCGRCGSATFHDLAILTGA